MKYIKGKMFIIIGIISTLGAQVIITDANWPYGLDQLGNQWEWYANSSPVSVNMDSLINQTTEWHFENGPTNEVWSSILVDLNQVPGTPPAGAQFAERQTLPGQPVSYMYEAENSTGMFVYGFYNVSYGDIYFIPYWIPYFFPLQLNQSWVSSFSWYYGGITIYETYQCSVVTEGTLFLPDPLGGPYPCLVIAQKYHAEDDFGIIQEDRWIYEWVVPDLGSAVTIMSQNPEFNPYFTIAERFIRMKSASLNETSPPVFSNTEVMSPSGCYGPFIVKSDINDPSGILTDSLYYRFTSGGGWQRVFHDSVVGETYYYTIPQVTPPDTVKYYLVAYDNSTNQNRGTDPENAPINYYSFYFIDPSNDFEPPVISGTTIWPDTTHAGPYPINSHIVDSGGCVDLALLYYRVGGTGSYTAIFPDTVIKDTYKFTIPQVTPPTLVEYYIMASDISNNSNVSTDPPNAPDSVYSFNVIDIIPPSFQGTTQWPDTAFNGPFPVKSIITDPAGISWARIYYRIQFNPWDSSSYDSVIGDTFHFTIPPINQTSVIRYYLKASDNNANIGRDPANPGEYYSFIATYVAVEESKEIPKKLELSVIPQNPIRNSLTLRLQIPKKSSVSLSIYDVAGSKAITPLNKPFSPGVYSISINTEVFGQGVYFLVLKTPYKTLRQKIVIIK